MSGSETQDAHQELVRSLVVERFRLLPRQTRQRPITKPDQPSRTVVSDPNGDHKDGRSRTATERP